jgi:hypothetical protein
MAKAVMEAFPALPLMSFGTSKKEMANARTKFALALLSGSGLLDVFLISLYEVVSFVMWLNAIIRIQVNYSLLK